MRTPDINEGGPMVTSLHNKRITTTTCATRLALVSLVLAAIVALGIFFAHLNAPASGNACSVRHATSQDADGRTMWCDRAMSGHHPLVWQYNWV
jgi:hypothetical protein